MSERERLAAAAVMVATMPVQTYSRTETITGETKNLASDFAKAVGLPVHKQPWHQRAQVCQRNAPCPCGSGKKFKKCHGGSRT